MNLGDLDIHIVHNNRPQLNHVLTDDLPVTPLNVRLEADRTPSFASSTSDPATVVRWQTPPSRIRSPEHSTETLRPDNYAQQIGVNEAAYRSDTPLVGVRFDEEQIRSNEAQASRRDRNMDNVSLDSSPPTPIDDTPYIRFAIDQLTRDEDIRAMQRPSTTTSSDSYPVERIVPDNGLGYMSAAEREREALALIRKHRSSPAEGRLFAFNATRPLSFADAPVTNVPLRQHRTSDPEVFIPVHPPLNTPRYPDLTFVPTMLRLPSTIMLSCLCLLMIAALMFCAIYSSYNHGLVAWSGGIYGGLYFVFSFLPQLLAACIFIYVQGVMSAMTRIMPYTLMAMDDVESRTNALFIDIFPRSMLWPKWQGPMIINVAYSFLWLSVFTVPLQGCLFSVVEVDGAWRWTTVQGVAWTLVGVYILIFVGVGLVGLFFTSRTTGLMWDPRSLADIVALLPRSNCLRDYPGTDIMRKKEDIRYKLNLRSDRLGYWRTPNETQGLFYCVGEEGASTRQYTLNAGKLHEKPSILDDASDVEKAAELYNTNTRYRYIPWFLRDTFVIFWTVAAFFLLLALFIISFLPSTAIRNGFDPLVDVVSNSAGWSPANFLYSFIPSIIGMILYLFFQPLDMAVRKLQPWTELGRPHGAIAEQSLLLDYPACAPLTCTLKALANGHYRVAMLSLLSFLFILLPTLAGGIFFPLTTPSGPVRMIPNLPSFYIILSLLILYLFGLLILIPNRHSMHLPHGVDCLVEIFSFVYGSQILDDAAFRAPKSKADLATRLMAEKVRGERNRWAFGVYRGRNGMECLGIERLGRRGVQDVMVISGR
ncbi:uncharacterized protein PAC_08355 [Phialocephala subalpina]|uniref:Phosphoribosylaminoimidazole-succinocarboxamide synthase n=1 Tax=Phialocephala subalpina TaxID=576137 RepID=A0A1L7X0B9_9HELO|nr:uncharacterized protein PAC_08355 [Phialocephala subalpina]